MKRGWLEKKQKNGKPAAVYMDAQPAYYIAN